MPGSSPGMHDVREPGSDNMRSSLPLCLPRAVLADTRQPQPTPNPAPTGFQSPSKNITCQYFDYDKQNTLRCDISAMETKPRRPADCDLDYGGAFEMNAKGPAARICHGDTVMDNSLPVLGYGEVWQRGGFTCTVGADGRDVLQRGTARVFAGAGEAGGVSERCSDAASNTGRHTPRRRSIQYAAASRFYRSCSGILDPRAQLRLGGDDGESEDASVPHSITGTCLATSRGTVPSSRGSLTTSTCRRNGRKPERW